MSVMDGIICDKKGYRMNTSRRTFLKAAAAPLILPASLWAAQTSPNARIRVGFIGMGKQNMFLLEHFLYRTQVAAVCDVDTTRRLAAQQRVNDFYTLNPEKGKPGCAAFNDFEEVLTREDIDAVCIATPDHWHTIILLAALRAGKDVYCEKPLTHDVAESVDVLKTLQSSKCVVQTGSMQRSSREFRVACELVRNGVIGKVQRVTCSFGDPGIPCDLPEEPMEPGLDWNRWLGPAPVRPYNTILSPRGIPTEWVMWRNYREFGGGAVADIGAHHLDIAQWGLGMDDSGPVEVLLPEDKSAKHGAVLMYAGNIPVSHIDDDMAVKFYGTEGQVNVDREKFWLMLGDKTIAKFTQREDGGTLDSALARVEKEFLKDAKTRLYKVRENHVSDFLESVVSRQKPITCGQIGARSAICCHLLNMAYHYGRAFRWNPADCTFADGTGDPAWLTGSRRDYRA